MAELLIKVAIGIFAIKIVLLIRNTFLRKDY